MFSLFLLSSLLLFHLSLSYTYQDYKAEFGKVYPAGEDSVHEAAFNASMQYIRTVNSMNLSYVLGPTKWSDQSLDDIQGIVRINFSQSEVSNFMIKTLSGGSNLKVSVPNSLDWVSQGKVSEVRDQGNCGSCWAFATASVVESLFMIHNQTNPVTSAKYLLQCTANSSCNGGYVNKAMELSLKTGLPLETRYPYSSLQPSDGICTNQDGFLHLPSDTKLQTYLNLSSDDTRSAVARSPYVALMVADYGFMNYKSGVYFCNYSTIQSDLNHAVTVVGYDSNGNIMIKNSWGKGWGVNGFGWISGNSSRNCGLNLFGYGLTSEKFVSTNQKYEPHLMLAVFLMIGVILSV